MKFRVSVYLLLILLSLAVPLRLHNFFNGQPIASAYLFLVSGILLVVVSFLLINKFVDKDSAFIISLLIAISPHTIFLSKGAYSPNLSVFIFILLLFCFLQFIKTGKNLYTFLMYFLIGIGVQMHYTFLANSIIVFLLTLLFKYKLVLNYRFYLYAFLGFLIPLIPFIAGQFQLGFVDFTNISKYLFSNKHLFVSWQTVINKLIYPFEIYFPREYLATYLQVFVSSIYFIILFFTIFIAFSKTNLSNFTKIILGFYFLGVLISILLGLSYWWWYQDFFSLTILIMVGVVVVYLFKYAKLKFLWLVVISIFIFWNLTWLDKIYLTPRTPDIPERMANIIINDIKTNGVSSKQYGIMVFDLVSNGSGFEQRYFLEKASYFRKK